MKRSVRNAKRAAAEAEQQRRKQQVNSASLFAKPSTPTRGLKPGHRTAFGQIQNKPRIADGDRG